MRERPILFSAPMVLAILAGRKTQTRRLVKAPEISLDPRSVDYAVNSCVSQTEEGFGASFLTDRGCSRLVPCPYGQPGDRLWVRETLRRASDPRRTWTYAADGAPVQLARNDPRLGAMFAWAHHKEGDVCVSIHMPRWASRLKLEIESVRVERLQDISEEDAKAEGVDAFTSIGPDQRLAGDGRNRTQATHPHTIAFASLWDSINGDRASWASNPWVWVVEFKRAEVRS